MCMCVCVYVYVYACIHIHIYAQTHTHTHTFTYVCVYYIYTCVYIYIYTIKNMDLCHGGVVQRLYVDSDGQRELLMHRCRRWKRAARHLKKKNLLRQHLHFCTR
jgi:hypothetical protein